MGTRSSASLLARASVLGLWLRLDVADFRLIRARGGHGHALMILGRGSYNRV